MNKEIRKKLTKNFSKEVVQPPPPGKFGQYVPHHIYTQRLVDVLPGGYDFTFDAERDKDGAIVGAKCRLYLKDADQTIEEVGDVSATALSSKKTESEILKLAVSDGLKRCCMRIGLGLELWTGDMSEEEFYSTDKVKEPVQKTTEEPKKKEVTQESGKSPSNNVKELGEIILDMCVGDKVLAKKVWDYSVGKVALKKDLPKNIKDYSDDNNKTFIEEAAKYLKMLADQDKEREGNSEIINDTIDVLDAEIKQVKSNAPDYTEKQLQKFEQAVQKAVNDGEDELAAKAKKFLNSGMANKLNILDWVKTDSDWSLKDGSL